MKNPIRFTLILIILSLTTCFVVHLCAELLAIASLHGGPMAVGLFSFLVGSFIFMAPASFLALLRSHE